MWILPAALLLTCSRFPDVLWRWKLEPETLTDAAFKSIWKSIIFTVLLFYHELSLFYRNRGIFSSSQTLVTVMSTQCCQPKSYTEHLQITASVSRYRHFLEMPKPYRTRTQAECWFPACWTPLVSLWLLFFPPVHKVQLSAGLEAVLCRWWADQDLLDHSHALVKGWLADH